MFYMEDFGIHFKTQRSNTSQTCSSVWDKLLQNHWTLPKLKYLHDIRACLILWISWAETRTVFVYRKRHCSNTRALGGERRQHFCPALQRGHVDYTKCIRLGWTHRSRELQEVLCQYQDRCDILDSARTGIRERVSFPGLEYWNSNQFQSRLESESGTEQSKAKDLMKTKTDQALWKQCFDENSGRVYFYHTQTRETTWDIPEELKTDVEKLAPSEKREVSPQPLIGQRLSSMKLILMPMLRMNQYASECVQGDDEKELSDSQWTMAYSEVCCTSNSKPTSWNICFDTSLDSFRNHPNANK